MKKIGEMQDVSYVFCSTGGLLFLCMQSVENVFKYWGVRCVEVGKGFTEEEQKTNMI
jgi:hypothetical protein